MFNKFAKDHRAIKIDINTDEVCIMEAPVSVLIRFMGYPEYKHSIEGVVVDLQPEHLWDVCVYFQLYHVVGINNPYIMTFRTVNPFGDSRICLNKENFDIIRNFVQECYDDEITRGLVAKV